MAYPFSFVFTNESYALSNTDIMCDDAYCLFRLFESASSNNITNFLCFFMARIAGLFFHVSDILKMSDTFLSPNIRLKDFAYVFCI